MWLNRFFPFFSHNRRVYSYPVDVSHRDKKFSRPSDMKWIAIDDLETDRQYQFWVTAVTNAGEGMRSDIVLQTPSNRGTYLRHPSPPF